METSLADYFRICHAYSKKLELSANTRSILYTLIGEFNEGFWPEELSFSDRTLQELSGVKSLRTIHDAKNTLKSYGFINFRPGKNRKSIYRLLNPVNTLQTPTAQPSKHFVNTLQTLEPRPNIRAREDCKDVEDVKTEEKNRGGAGARICEDVFKVWAEEMPRPLTASEKYELADIEEKYPVEKITDAIRRTRRERYYPTFGDFLAILEGKDIRTRKGGERIERTAEPKQVYTNITDTGDEPWYK